MVDHEHIVRRSTFHVQHMSQFDSVGFHQQLISCPKILTHSDACYVEGAFRKRGKPLCVQRGVQGQKTCNGCHQVLLVDSFVLYWFVLFCFWCLLFTSVSLLFWNLRFLHTEWKEMTKNCSIGSIGEEFGFFNSMNTKVLILNL